MAAKSPLGCGLQAKNLGIVAALTRSMQNLSPTPHSFSPTAILWQALAAQAPWISEIQVPDVPSINYATRGFHDLILGREDTRAILACFRQLVLFFLEDEGLSGMIHCFERLERKHEEMLQENLGKEFCLRKKRQDHWISDDYLKNIATRKNAMEKFDRGVHLTADFLSLFWRHSACLEQEHQNSQKDQSFVL